MAYNKIVFAGQTLIDLTDSEVTAADVLADVDFYGADGEKHAGSMTNRGAVTGTIATHNGVYTIPKGYHNGNGTVQISATEAAKITADNGNNIRAGVTILGQLGRYTGEAPTLQTITKSYTPTATAQTENITAGTGYDAIEKVTVTVAAIPYVETANTYGTTVTIG